MLRKLKMWMAGVMVLCGLGVMVGSAMVQVEPVYAAKVPGTNIIFNGDDEKKEDGIKEILKLIVNILLYGLGAAATLGVVIAGILYLTARDNPQQVAKAKMRLIEISIGLAAWAMLYMVLRFLIPGFTGIN